MAMNRSPAGMLAETTLGGPVIPAGDPHRRSERSRIAGIRARMSDERGAALTEFALVLPLLLLLLLGMIDFGKAINYWIDETHLANEGARWAAVNNNPGSGAGLSLQQYILGQTDTGELRGTVRGTQQTAHAAAVKICFYKASDGSSVATGAVGDTVEVIVSYDYNWLHYLTAKAGIGPSTTITGKSAMRVEAPPTNYTSDSGCPSAA
jgi:Flp pilus assembly protein TadG